MVVFRVVHVSVGLLAVVVSFRGVGVVVTRVVDIVVVAFVAVGVSSVEGVVGDHGSWLDPGVVVVF